MGSGVILAIVLNLSDAKTRIIYERESSATRKKYAEEGALTRRLLIITTCCVRAPIHSPWKMKLTSQVCTCITASWMLNCIGRAITSRNRYPANRPAKAETKSAHHITVRASGSALTQQRGARTKQRPLIKQRAPTKKQIYSVSKHQDKVTSRPQQQMAGAFPEDDINSLT